MRNYFKVTSRPRGAVRSNVTPFFFDDHDAGDTLRAHAEASELVATCERAGLSARISVWFPSPMFSGVHVIGTTPEPQERA